MKLHEDIPNVFRRILGEKESGEQPFLRGTHRLYQIQIPIKLHEDVTYGVYKNVNYTK